MIILLLLKTDTSTNASRCNKDIRVIGLEPLFLFTSIILLFICITGNKYVKREGT